VLSKRMRLEVKRDAGLYLAQIVSLNLIFWVFNAVEHPVFLAWREILGTGDHYVEQIT